MPTTPRHPCRARRGHDGSRPALGIPAMPFVAHALDGDRRNGGRLAPCPGRSARRNRARPQDTAVGQERRAHESKRATCSIAGRGSPCSSYRRSDRSPIRRRPWRRLLPLSYSVDTAIRQIRPVEQFFSALFGCSPIAGHLCHLAKGSHPSHPVRYPAK